MRPDPIPIETLKEIISCGFFAPSGSDQQPWHFAVVTRRGLINEFASAVAKRVQEIKNRINSPRAAASFDGYVKYLTFFADASAVICVFVEPYRGLLERLLARYAADISVATREHVSVQSAAAAIQNILLAAHAAGFASCWLTGPLIAKDEIEAHVKPAGEWSLLAMIALGRRDENRPLPKATPRRPETETLSFYI